MIRLKVCGTCESIMEREVVYGGGSDLEISFRTCERCCKTTVGSGRPKWLDPPLEAKLITIVYK